MQAGTPGAPPATLEPPRRCIERFFARALRVFPVTRWGNPAWGVGGGWAIPPLPWEGGLAGQKGGIPLPCGGGGYSFTCGWMANSSCPAKMSLMVISCFSLVKRSRALFMVVKTSGKEAFTSRSQCLSALRS